MKIENVESIAKRGLPLKVYEAFWLLFFASLSLQVLIKLQALQLFSIITCYCRYSSLILTR